MRSALNIPNVKNWLMVAYTFGGVIDHFSVAKIIEGFALCSPIKQESGFSQKEESTFQTVNQQVTRSLSST